jgi:hypothetical protein
MCSKLEKKFKMKCLIWKKIEYTKGVIRSRKTKKKNNTMFKWKITKWQIMVYRTLPRKLRLSKANHTKNRDNLMCPVMVSSSCSTSGTRRVTLVANPMISCEWEFNSFFSASLLSMHRNWLKQIDWFGVMVMCPSLETCLPANCIISELAHCVF